MVRLDSKHLDFKLEPEDVAALRREYERRKWPNGRGLQKKRPDEDVAQEMGYSLSGLKYLKGLPAWRQESHFNHIDVADDGSWRVNVVDSAVVLAEEMPPVWLDVYVPPGTMKLRCPCCSRVLNDVVGRRVFVDHSDQYNTPGTVLLGSTEPFRVMHCGQRVRFWG